MGNIDCSIDSRTYLAVGDGNHLATAVVGGGVPLRGVEGDDELLVGVLPATGTSTNRGAVVGSP